MIYGLYRFIWQNGWQKFVLTVQLTTTLRARFMGPTWGPSGADRTQVGPMLAPWSLLSGKPLSDQWWPGLLTHISITQPWCVKQLCDKWYNVSKSLDIYSDIHSVIHDPLCKNTSCKLNPLTCYMKMLWNGNTFHITGPLWVEFNGHCWIPFTKDQWCRALMLLLMSSYANCQTNSWEAEKLKCLGGHLTSL